MSNLKVKEETFFLNYDELFKIVNELKMTTETFEKRNKACNFIEQVKIEKGMVSYIVNTSSLRDYLENLLKRTLSNEEFEIIKDLDFMSFESFDDFFKKTSEIIDRNFEAKKELNNEQIYKSLGKKDIETLLKEYEEKISQKRNELIKQSRISHVDKMLDIISEKQEEYKISRSFISNLKAFKMSIEMNKESKELNTKILDYINKLFYSRKKYSNFVFIEELEDLFWQSNLRRYENKFQDIDIIATLKKEEKEEALKINKIIDYHEANKKISRYQIEIKNKILEQKNRINRVLKFGFKTISIEELFIDEIKIDLLYANLLRKRSINNPELLDHDIELLEEFIKKYIYSYMSSELNFQDRQKYESITKYYNKNVEEEAQISLTTKDNKDIEIIKLSFEFFEGDLEHVKKHFIKKLNVLKESNKKINVQERIDFLNSLKLANYIVGKNSFEGYVGLVLDDGTIIVENFNVEGNSKNNATYIANGLDEFYQIVKLSKSGASKLIREELINAEKANHVENWKQNVLSKIEKVQQKRTI